MCTHEYLHYYSNHPKHLKDSLPYSKGIRIIKVCTNREDRITELNNLVQKFRNRCYPEKVLLHNIEKLTLLQRNDILRPKSSLLIQILLYHNPEILDKYNVSPNPNPDVNSNNDIYLILPYYNSIERYSDIIKDSLIEELNKCDNEEYRTSITVEDLKVSYKKVNSLSNFVK